MSDKEPSRPASIPAPATVPRPSAAPPGGRAPRNRTSTLQGPASVPSPARSVPPAPPPPTEIPKPGRLPGAELLDGGPPPIPALETPLPAAAAPAAAEGPRRRSRRTVQIPNDAVPMSSVDSGNEGDRSSDPARLSDSGPRSSEPSSLPEPAMDFVIQPMRIISVASDLPAVESARPAALEELAAAPAEAVSTSSEVPTPEAPAVAAVTRRTRRTRCPRRDPGGRRRGRGPPVDAQEAATPAAARAHQRDLHLAPAAPADLQQDAASGLRPCALGACLAPCSREPRAPAGRVEEATESLVGRSFR
jgi:hypothetical protein